MTLFPKVKIKTLLSFPAAVYGGAGIAVNLVNGKYYFNLDFSTYPVVGSIPAADLPNTNVLTYNKVSKAYLLAPYSYFSAALYRTRLFGLTNLYVAPGGNDITGDGSQANPWATPNKALTYAIANFDFGGQTVNINCAAGAYAFSMAIAQPLVGAGAIRVQGVIGDATQVVFNIAANGTGMQASNFGVIEFRYLTVNAGTNSTVFQGRTLGTITFGNMIINGAAGCQHLYTLPLGTISVGGPYTLNGVSAYHVLSEGGFINISGVVVTLGAGAGFTAFASANFGHYFRAIGNTFSGTATGQKYQANNAIIFTATGDPNYLPGNVAGTVTGSGSYG